jgi:predicted Rossmann-fold nucleotide-binding protein
MLTLLQTGKLQRRNLILIYGREYWDRVLNWREMVSTGTISHVWYDEDTSALNAPKRTNRIKRNLFICRQWFNKNFISGW